MQNHLAAAAKNQIERRYHYWLRRITQTHRRALESSPHQVEFFPVFLLRPHQHQHDVGAHAEVCPLISYYQANEILFNFGKRLLQHLQGVAANRIHLRMKLQARDAVANVDQRGARIFLDDAGAILN